MQYGFSKTVKCSFEEAIKKVTDELKKEGFGVLTTIDVKDTLKKKIDVDFRRYTILGRAIRRLRTKRSRPISKWGF